VGERIFLRAQDALASPRIACRQSTTSTMGERIESLFSSSFLRRATTTAGATTRTKEEGGTMLGSSRVRGYDDDEYDDDNDDYRVATIRDGGILVVPFPDDAKMATFRGKKSESGNGIHDMPEPCQCNAARRHVRRDANDIDDDLDYDEDDDGGGGGVWDTPYLDGGTARRLLGIHQNIALSDGECHCRDDDDRYRRCRRTNVPNVDDAACDNDEDDDDDVVKRRRRSPCNFDLLQAFRYDAVATPSPSPPTSSRLRDDDDDRGIGAALLPLVAPMALGSSPHTDWGTLTVVSS
jgi:hypothetical protein